MSAALLLVLMARHAVALLSAALRSEELRTAPSRFEVKAVITTPEIAAAVADLLRKGNDPHPSYSNGGNRGFF